MLKMWDVVGWWYDDAWMGWWCGMLLDDVGWCWFEILSNSIIYGSNGGVNSDSLNAMMFDEGDIMLFWL